jgi:exopolysaccharide biosynthesis polyprenyl glycosylphosphotransferase
MTSTTDNVSTSAFRSALSALRRDRRARPRTPDEERIVAVVQPQISVLRRPLWAAASKRLIDIVGALAGLVLLSPLLVATAIAIRLDSRGPILFAQTRIGRGGALFRMYKFRSMIDGADAKKAELTARNEFDGVAFKMRDDPRVTRVGRFIRKYSIDELPQLLNVLTGDMSIVGPRPVVTAEALCYKAWQLRRFSVAPGLTCLWQVSGRSDTSFDDWMRLDLSYIDGWSFWLDLKLIMKTVRVVISGEGAY